MTTPKKLYHPRNLSDLEPHYSHHVTAMTAENLDSKGDIAAELAARDAEILRLRGIISGIGLTVLTEAATWENTQ